MNPDTRILFELDGTPWVYNPHTQRWECGLIDRGERPESLTFGELTANYTVSDWNPMARAA